MSPLPSLARSSPKPSRTQDQAQPKPRAHLALTLLSAQESNSRRPNPQLLAQPAQRLNPGPITRARPSSPARPGNASPACAPLRAAPPDPLTPWSHLPVDYSLFSSARPPARRLDPPVLLCDSGGGKEPHRRHHPAPRSFPCLAFDRLRALPNPSPRLAAARCMPRVREPALSALHRSSASVQYPRPRALASTYKTPGLHT